MSSQRKGINNMWQPKHPAFLEYAEKVVNNYRQCVESGQDSRKCILELAKKYGVSDTQIYRYLKFKGVELPKTVRERDQQGRYISINI